MLQRPYLCKYTYLSYPIFLQVILVEFSPCFDLYRIRQKKIWIVKLQIDSHSLFLHGFGLTPMLLLLVLYFVNDIFWLALIALRLVATLVPTQLDHGCYYLALTCPFDKNKENQQFDIKIMQKNMQKKKKTISIY